MDILTWIFVHGETDQIIGIVITHALFFVDVMEDLYNYVNPLNKHHSPMISKETLDIVLENKAVGDIWLFLNVCKQSRWRF